MSNNFLTLAVAGSGKTTQIIDDCSRSADSDRTLVLTYTRTNQDVLRHRLGVEAGDKPNIAVAGWFSFLIADIARPFTRFAFEDARVFGFDFHSDPQTYAANTEYRRYFTGNGEVRRVHLPQLCMRIIEASGGAVLDRMSRLYDRIYVDEVQDLCGYDLDILDFLMSSPIEIHMVGDVRQAVLATNEREARNKKYMYMNIWDWFREKQAVGELEITQRSETRRCRPEIALFADSLFGEDWDFESTRSLNEQFVGHDGLFLVSKADVPEYLHRTNPFFLKHPASARAEPYDFINFRMSKGSERDHVLIWPTAGISKLIQKGTMLEPRPATELYVACTRARQSVGFVLDSSGASEIQRWQPEI